MPRVKRSVHARKKRRKVLEQAKRLLGAQALELPPREGAGRALARLRLPRPQDEEADDAAALDHPHQRSRAPARPLVQPVHRRAARRRRSSSTARSSPTSPSAIPPRSAASPSRRRRPFEGPASQEAVPPGWLGRDPRPARIGYDAPASACTEPTPRINATAQPDHLANLRLSAGGTRGERGPVRRRGRGSRRRGALGGDRAGRSARRRRDGRARAARRALDAGAPAARDRRLPPRRPAARDARPDARALARRRSRERR